jgi:hypothetical protein
MGVGLLLLYGFEVVGVGENRALMTVTTVAALVSKRQRS